MATNDSCYVTFPITHERLFRMAQVASEITLNKCEYDTSFCGYLLEAELNWMAENEILIVNWQKHTLDTVCVQFESAEHALMFSLTWLGQK